MTSPRHLTWAITLLLWGTALCFVKLFNLLAFEFAFACSLPISFCAAHLGINQLRERQTLIFSDQHAWQTWRLSAFDAISLSLIPLIPISINGLWVKNCDWLEGLTFYLCLPIVTAIVASGWGVVLARLSRGIWSFVLLFLLVLLYAFLQFVWTPVVDLFSPFMGYYPGSLYDEEVSIGLRLICSRLEDISWIVLLLSLQDLFSDPFQFRRRVRFGFFSLSVIIIYLWGNQLDLHRTTSHIQARLGGYAKSEHFHMYYPQAWRGDKVKGLTAELEFNYKELKDFLKRDVNQKISVYFYENARTKKRLMGAGKTLIAKPWQYAIHVHQPSIGDRVITHELSHIFSAEIASPPHHLSLYKGFIPHMSLIEGFAVAATWSKGRLDPHQWSAALTQMGVAPNIRDLLSPNGFYSKSSGIAYTLCGSFVRFYRERKGLEALNDFYRSGGSVLTEEELNRLFGQWEDFLKNIPLSKVAKQHAEGIFNRPSIFHKVCAHEVAEQRTIAFNFEARGEWEAALSQWELILNFTPGDNQAVLHRIKALYTLSRLKEASEVAKEALSSSTSNELTRQRAREWIEDLKVLQGIDGDQLQYHQIIKEVFNRSQLRRLAIKNEAARQGDVGSKILKLLLSPHAQEDLLKTLEELIDQDPQWASLHYLYGRALLKNKKIIRGLKALDQAIYLVLSHPSLTYEAYRLKANIAFHQAKYHDATIAYEQLSQQKDLNLDRGEIFNLKRWARRAEFFERRKMKNPNHVPQGISDADVDDVDREEEADGGVDGGAHNEAQGGVDEGVHNVSDAGLDHKMRAPPSKSSPK